MLNNINYNCKIKKILFTLNTIEKLDDRSILQFDVILS